MEAVPRSPVHLEVVWQIRRPGAREVRTRLSSLGLPPTREADIVDELSQHLDDRWRELMAGGALPDEATQLTLAEFRDGNVLARAIASLRLAHQPSSIRPGAPGGRVLGDLLQDPALRATHDGGETRVHDGRHPLAGPRHRSQHRHIQPVEWRTARVTARGAQTRATGDALQSRRIRELVRPPRGPSVVAHLRRVRAIAGPRRG